MDETKRAQIAEMIAQRLLDDVDQKTLECMYYDMQEEWANSLPDDELLQTAEDLGLEI